MNRDLFIDLLSNYSQINNDQLKELVNLEKKYPYSEAIHALVATGKFKTNGGSKASLSIAALYSTDRSILKHLIETKPVVEPIKKVETGQATVIKPKPTPRSKPKTQPVKKVSETKQTKTEIENPDAPKLIPEDEMELIRNELMNNLQELQKSKEHFLELFEGNSSKSKRKSLTRKSPTKAESKKTNVKPQQKPSVDSKKSQTKASLENSDTETAVAEKNEVVTQETTLEEEKIEELIESLAEQRSESKKKDSKNLSDLSIPSVEFGDDLVSENLANILIKQGKKGKAIDIYKKLIWKFPQKKAYFASQIEKLKEE